MESWKEKSKDCWYIQVFCLQVYTEKKLNKYINKKSSNLVEIKEKN